MLELLQVIGDGSPGGGTTAVLSLSQELHRQGVAVTIASQRASHIIDEARSRGLRTLELDFRKRRNTAAIAQRFSHYLRMAPPTIVHAHGARAGLPVAMLPREIAGSTIYTIHGFHYRQKPAGTRHLARMIERFCIRRSHTTVFVSNSDERIARQDDLIAGEKRRQIIRNGCPEAESSPEPSTPTYDIAFLGRLHFQKNPLILPEILEALRPARPRLCIIGAGEYEAELRRRIADAGLSDQVTFCGAQPHAKALEMLANARIMLLPSRWEGLPISVIEAMHRAVPVVASNVPGTDELVLDGRTGYLVDVDDVAGYADRLRGLLSSDGGCRDMGRQALQHARANFSLQPLVNAHLSLYASVAAQRDKMQ